jgi:hypothetical protein
VSLPLLAHDIPMPGTQDKHLMALGSWEAHAF